MMDRGVRQFAAFNPRPSTRRAFQLGLVYSILGGFFLTPFSVATGLSSNPTLPETRLRREGQSQPGPNLWVRLSGCEPAEIAGACSSLPELVAELEASPEDEATRTIHIQVGDRETQCVGRSCAIALEETGPEGVGSEFWVEPEEERRPRVYTATLRVIPAGPTEGENNSPWFVQVLSSQWIGEAIDACAVAWDTFPPVGSPPDWLATPEEPSTLASETMYHHLAASLITAGAVEASDCPDGGLIDEDTPSACGVETAMPYVLGWQDQFDPAILGAAQESRIPAGLMKRLIAEESQFWPGSITERGEYGLGHLTEAGADNTLLWNPSFYFELCPTVLGEAYCGRGYSQQTDYRRAMLRGALIAAVEADCPECDLGVDLEAASEGISIIGQTLRAYCSQAGRMVSNVSRHEPGRTTTYEDMWRLTLAGYAAGPGCLADALREARRRGSVLTWESVSAQLTDPCTGVIGYVERISQ